ncbi:MAG: hypothetical protein H8E60_04465 [Candidatus Marinimicrobia bacterium]|nr:hypothetical protein [Candidatus Neomarinimicrobiota bacterium]
MKHTLLILSVLLLNFTFAQDCYSNTDCNDGSACISYPGDCNFENFPGYCLELMEDCNETSGISYCDCNGNDVEYISSLECVGSGVDYYGDCTPPCDEDICVDWINNEIITEEDAIFSSNFSGDIGWTYEISQDTIWIRQTVPQFEGEKLFEFVLKDNGINNLPDFIRFSVHIYWMMPYNEYSYELELGQIEFQDWNFNELHTGKITNNSVEHPEVFYFWAESENTTCNSDTDCDDDFACIPSLGDCEYEIAPGSCIDVDFNNICTTVIDYVCGCDGVTYGNECNANSMFGVGIAYEGECEPENTTCNSDTDCAYGFACIPPSGDCNFATGPGECMEPGGACFDDWVPVCGCDGETYSNECYAHRDGMGIAYEGECEEETDVTFYLGDIDYTNNTVEVWMENSIDIGGAQLWFSGFDIGGASGGLAGEYGWMFSGPANSVILFDLQGGTIPPGSGIFFNIYIINVPIEDLCITQAVASDISEQELTVSIGDCIPYEETEVTLTFDCPESVVAGSEENEITIMMENSVDVDGIQIEIEFDPNIIEITNVITNNHLGFTSWSFTDSSHIKILEFTGTGWFLTPGIRELYLIEFTGLHEGENQFSFSNIQMAHPSGNPIENIDFSDSCTIPVVEPFTDQCVELFGLPWPECLAESGYGIYNGSCEIVYCGTFDGYGNDWSPWIYDTMEACEEACPQEMVHFSIENQFAFTEDSIEVDIIMDNNSGSGGGIQMEILFDDEILGLNNVIAGAQYPPDWLLNFGGNTILGYSFNTTYLLMGSNQQLLQMQITALNEGMSIICMEDITVSDPNGQPHPTSSYCGVIQVEDMPLQHFTNILNGFENEYINYDDETGDGTTPIIFIEESDGVDVGDEIGLFDIGGVIGDECPPEYSEILVGASIFNGGPLEITTYGAIQNCDEDLLLPGFITGNEFIVKIWKAAENLEYPAYYNGQTGQLTWTPNNMNIPMLTPAPLISYDVNLDGELNVLDIILTVSIILGEAEELDITWGQEHTADTNSDGLINVIDILVMVNTIMEE